MTVPPQDRLVEYTIRVANPAQEVQHAKARFVMWSNNLSWDDFWAVDRRERAEAEWGIDGRLLTWALVRKDDLEGDTYAGCETYRWNGWVKRKRSDKVDDGYIYGIASVVTPKQHLRNGYATRLLSLLHHQLGPSSTLPPFPESWGAPPPLSAKTVPEAIGSILWSDVGSTFYSRCRMSLHRPGWSVKDSQNTELVWKILPPSSKSTSPSIDQLEDSWEWLYETDLTSIGEELSAAVKHRIQRTDTTERSVFVQDPASPGILSFVPLIGSWNRLSKRINQPIGLRIKSPSPTGEDTIVLFALHNGSIGARFLITCIHNLIPAQLPAVLRVLDVLAAQAGHKEGWVWDLGLSNDLVHAWSGLTEREVVVGRRQESGGHLLGTAWYGTEEEEGQVMEGEMWTWC
ncbi:hypothetical protein IAR55_003662 [Kwoniella newhampshirensis]|uniref:N-acetyltransferase domain-containing protein n=1 Tax=Kwoniella newhampshirensis TaxID=1651941 RepID=A0AAW0YXA6_9TREE